MVDNRADGERRSDRLGWRASPELAAMRYAERGKSMLGRLC